MTLFPDLPIRHKLRVAFLGTILAALLLACGTFVIYDMVTFRQSLLNNLTVLADALGKNSTAALSFAGKTEGARLNAEETLQALAFKGSVVSGCLYTADGQLFASYAKDDKLTRFPCSPGADGAHHDGKYLMIVRPVELNGKRIGSICIRSTQDELNEHFQSYAVISVFVFSSVSLLAFGLSSALRHLILQPIQQLADATKRITDHKDYSVRVPEAAKDEMGMLAHAFNQMLEGIQEREHALHSANEALCESEERLIQLNASLEERVRERTSQLAAANKELEAFSYSVSHDLRAPLRAVDGFSRMVIEDYAGLLDDEGRRMLGVIRSETQRMGRLIDDLLAFSRLGRQQMELESIDMHEMARAVFDELAAQEPPERKLTLDLYPLPARRGTQTMIRQVWVNLISNAIKFTRGREVGQIEIGALDGEDGVPVFHVKDNGAGFDMRFADKLFGVFQRLHSAEEFPGTGVGLALVQRIVHRHGGRVWAESEVGRGASFFFTIPNPEP